MGDIIEYGVRARLEICDSNGLLIELSELTVCLVVISVRDFCATMIDTGATLAGPTITVIIIVYDRIRITSSFLFGGSAGSFIIDRRYIQLSSLSLDIEPSIYMYRYLI